MINSTPQTKKDPWAKTKADLPGCLAEIIILPVRAWVISAALSILHDDYPAVPAFGFWTTMILIVAVNCLPVVWRIGKPKINKESS